MAHDGAAPVVDFVVDFVVGEDARPPARPAAAGPRPRRRRGAIALLAAVLALGAGLLIGRAVTTDQTTAARPTPARSAADSIAAVGPRARTSIRTAFGFCPQFTACSVTAQLPPAVLLALRAQFPGALVRSSTTMLIRRDNAPSDLSARQVVARAGSVTITVQVRARTVPGGTGPHGARQVTRATDDGHYVTVTADVTGTAPLPSYDRLDRLVADDRLLAQ